MEENREDKFGRLEDQNSADYVLPVRFGAKRSLATAVIFAAVALAIIIPEAFTHNHGFSDFGASILQTLMMIPNVLVVIVVAFAATTIVMKIYRKRKKYRPLRDGSSAE